MRSLAEREADIEHRLDVLYDRLVRILDALDSRPPGKPNAPGRTRLRVVADSERRAA